MLFRRISVITLLNLWLLMGSGIFLLPSVAKEEERKEETKVEMKEVRLTPDLPFYFLKSWREEIKIKLTRSLEKQIELRLDYANERLAEAYKVIEKKKYSVADKLLQKYESEIEKIEVLEAKEKSKTPFQDGQIQKRGLKKLLLEKAKGTIKGLLTLKVSSEAGEERPAKSTGKSFKERLSDLFRAEKPEFVSPVVK